MSMTNQQFRYGDAAGFILAAQDRHGWVPNQTRAAYRLCPGASAGGMGSPKRSRCMAGPQRTQMAAQRARMNADCPLSLTGMAHNLCAMSISIMGLAHKLCARSCAPTSMASLGRCNAYTICATGLPERTLCRVFPHEVQVFRPAPGGRADAPPNGVICRRAFGSRRW